MSEGVRIWRCIACGATLFPQEIGMAATWNPELMRRAAEISAIETRAAAIPWA